MKYDAMEENYDLVEVLGEKMLFTCNRIERNTVPPGLHVWEVRHDDECMGIPCQIADWIWVNHWGTLISKKNIKLNKHPRIDNRYRDLDYQTEWRYLGDEFALSEYIDF